MSWNAGADDSWNADSGGGADGWKEDNNGFQADGGETGDFTNDSGGFGGDSGGGDARTCRVCGSADHLARECPDKPANSGECYRCGQVGHNKADCTNEAVERPFTGTCRLCNQEGHAARNCPTAPPQVCKLCKQEGHKAAECTNRRAIDWTGIPELEPEEAWKKLVDAAKQEDLDAFRVCLKAYARALGEEFNIVQVEMALREANLPVHIIAVTFDKEKDKQLTVVDLHGNSDRDYVVSFQFTDKPKRAKFATGWPKDAQENQQRLANAGFVQDRGIPKCSRCGELGHISKSCSQEAGERQGPTITCIYCQETGHRARDCPQPRVDKFACRNCGKSGHNSKECPEPRSAEGVECHRCNETGHFSRDCPNAEARPPMACRNCGGEGHKASECTEPRNPDLMTCRNCDQKGHMSRDCPQPKDWSRVKCSNCGQMGHTIKRCKEPIADDNDGGSGGVDVGTSGGAGGGGWDSAPAASGGDSWNNDAVPVAASGGW